jgi:pimeloyl-ACP methyl ester carboxylesterase
MPTLVLLHGAWHGAWCWAAVQSELTGLGVATIAVDLPVTDIDAGLDRYADVVCQAVDGREEVVVVAHSLSGLVAPLVAERADVRGVVMLAALWPEPARSAREQARALRGIYSEEYRRAPMVRHDDGSTEVPSDVALELLYQDCDRAVAEVACARLRPQHWRVWAERSPLARWPVVPTVGLACRSDRMLGQVGMLRGADRASSSLAWLDSGHSPMLSIPRDLAAALAVAADQFAGLD